MSDDVRRLREALADRYAVDQEIGVGGMAVVYRARDPRHQRDVALKVLRQDVGDAAAADRFLREIRTAAGLQHPHIVPLFDSGQVGEHLFYVMPLIEGETIRMRLKREGPLPLEEAIRYTREVADALGYAHGRGIIHRDIKPENIFLGAGHALLGDFGIARAMDAAGLNLTGSGLAVGTPLYMSPEQAFASAHLDGRTDQYALACVLYEMIAGDPPFIGSNPQAVMARHTTDAVPPLATVRRVPPALEAAITRALAKSPADRWPTMGEFAAALDTALPVKGPSKTASWSRGKLGMTVAVGALAVAAALTTVPFKYGFGTANAAGTDVRSVAVMPFAYTGDSARAIIASGLTDDLVAALVRADLQVPDPSRVMQYRADEDVVSRVGRELKVSAVVTASVHIVQNRIRVTARLTDADRGQLLWQRNFDVDLIVSGIPRELFGIQEAMSRDIIAALLPQLRSERRNSMTRGVQTTELEAYELTARGKQELRNITLPGSERAVAYFNRAIALDSLYADAWLGLARALDGLMQLSGQSPTDLMFRFRGAIEKAAALDSLSPDVIVVRARMRLYHEYDLAGFEREMQRALRLYPHNAFVHFSYGQELHTYGLRDSALKVLERAAELDPSNVFTIVNIGTTLISLGRIDEGRRFSRRGIATDSTQWLAFSDLAVAAHSEGRYDEAADLIARARALQADSPWMLGWVIQCSVRARPQVAHEAMERLTERARTEYVQHVFLAHAHLALGDRLRALEELEASLRVRERDLFSKLAWSEFEQLRGEPRYERIIEATGLTESLRSPERRRHRGRDLAICEPDR